MSRAAFSPEGVTFGVCLVALGVLGTLANLGRLELLPVVRTWWPLSLVLWGALELVDLFARRSSRGRSE
jgi:cell wall-active antibiotic response 4TMS protein YvqF